MIGLILARRRAVTVPALLLATVSSTLPRATFWTVTGTGFGRNTVSFTSAMTARIPAATRSLLTQRFIKGRESIMPGKPYNDAYYGGGPMGSNQAVESWVSETERLTTPDR